MPAEVLLVFEDTIRGPHGNKFVARACGQPCPDGRWEGWLEFIPVTGDERAILRTERETTQPNRTDTLYWATGLSTIFLEGALTRAMAPDRVPIVRDLPARERAILEPTLGPRVEVRAPVNGSIYRAVMNPFEVYAQGEDVLRRELRALSEGHLRGIARANAFGGLSADQLSTMKGAELE